MKKIACLMLLGLVIGAAGAQVKPMGHKRLAEGGPIPQCGFYCGTILHPLLCCLR